MKMQIIKKDEELYQYLPQRPPFVMVDKLYEKGASYVVSGLEVKDSNILVENGVFNEGGLVENIAQTAALYAGTKFIDAGQEVPVGYIAGIKKLKIKAQPLVGEEIYTRTTLTHDFSNIQVVEGAVFNMKDECIAECELRIFIKQES
ncbi:hypothetical protein RCC89_04350 [Cytophagaceae bacterium ABcell3]|nr:hypothetical protein RCC89_04350 [Cytophagaceae bacterium ABcell3]